MEITNGIRMGNFVGDCGALGPSFTLFYGLDGMGIPGGKNYCICINRMDGMVLSGKKTSHDEDDDAFNEEEDEFDDEDEDDFDDDEDEEDEYDDEEEDAFDDDEDEDFDEEFGDEFGDDELEDELDDEDNFDAYGFGIYDEDEEEETKRNRKSHEHKKGGKKI